MIRKLFIIVIDFYKLAISPLLGNNCRYHPTCSIYMKQALTKYGIVKGLFLGLKRLLRCNPFFPGGYDPLSEEE